ncbi:MAG: hypothetical protein WCJ33_01530, partial [Pseudomonadota bacterium]
NRDGDKIEYETAIFGKIGDLFQKIGDKLLTDLDLSYLNEYGTLAEVVGSWLTPYENFYPLLDNGYQPFQVAVPNFSTDKIPPAIRCDVIFETILSSVGYTVADTATLYSETKMDKLYVPCVKEWRRKAVVIYNYDVTIGGAGQIVTATIRILRKRTGILENLLLLTWSTSYVQSGSIEVELDYGDEIYDTIDSNSGYPTAILGLASYRRITFTDTAFAYNVPADLYVYDNPGIGAYSIPTTPFAIHIWALSVDPYSIYDSGTGIATIPAKNFQGFLPDNFKQRDFLIGLIRMFNLYLEPSKDAENILNILPRDTYYSQGEIQDWTYKADVGQVIEEVPMGELDWKDYLLSFKKDDDWYNKRYTDVNKEIYGQRLITTENDFLTAKKNIELPFSQTPLVGSSLNDLVLPSIIKENVNTSTNNFTGNLRLVYYVANQYIGLNSGLFQLNGTNRYSYPFCGHLIGTEQAPTFDFNFAAPRELFYVMDNPSIYPVSSNLYTEFYQNFMLEITDRYSKLVTMYLNLTSEDIRQLDFRDTYFINQTYYRLNRVIDYNPIGNKLTKCEFLRIRDAVEIIPAQSGNNFGFVTVNQSRAPQTVLLSNDSVGDLYQSDESLTDMLVGGLRGKEISDTTPTDGDILIFRRPATASAFTNGFSNGFGSVQAEGTWDIEVLPTSGGTVTTVAALTLGTTGTDLSSSVANPTTTPVITLNVPTASASNRGVLSSADWTTFNNKGSGTVTSVNAGTNISVTGTATDPIINSLSDRYKTSSVTSNSISNGSKSFTVGLDLSYIPLQEILVVYDPSNHMHGEVTSYNSATGALVVNIKTHTGSGTYTSWVLNLDGTPVDALSGSGTTNEIAYFTGAQTLSSLPVATYPSLTELSYVKSVSSAIQTQINGKQATLGFTPEDVANKQTNLAASATKYPTVDAVNTGLALKANLASPTFTGNPLAPTPTVGDNDTSIATTAFVTTAINNSGSNIFMAQNFN